MESEGERGAQKSNLAEEASNQWYLQECNRGEQLLVASRVHEAAEVFEALLGPLGDAPSYERAVVLKRLSHCLHQSGRPDLAAGRLREALAITGQLELVAGVQGLRGMLYAELGEALRTTGQRAEAAQAYEAALALFQQIREPALEAVTRYQLGRVFHEQCKWDEAERHYQEAAVLREAAGDWSVAAQLWSQLALLCQEAGRPEPAQTWYRKAIDCNRQNGDATQLAHHLSRLAALLYNQPGRLEEAHHLVDQVLAATHRMPDPLVASSWNIYGIVAEIIEKEALTAAEGARRVSLQSQASQYRQLQQYAPQFIAALARLGNESGYARVVILGRLSRCFQMACRPELAIARLREALAIIGQLGSGEGVDGLWGMLHAELGEALSNTGQYAEARQAFEAALAIAGDLHDLRGQALAEGQLGDLSLTEGQLADAHLRYRAALALFQQIREPSLEAVSWHQLGQVFHKQGKWEEAEHHYREATRLRAAGAQTGAAQLSSQLALLREAGRAEAAEDKYRKAIGIESETDLLAVNSGPSGTVDITLHEQLTTDYVIEPDLLIDGRHENRIGPSTRQPQSLAEHLRPMLVPCARTYVDDIGAVHIALPCGEPHLERHPGCTIVRRVRREVAISGNSTLVWRLIRKMDGSCTVAEILGGMPADERAEGARLLARLAATEAIDVSGRPIGRFLHLATKKGVLPAGGLESDQILDLATDGNYRVYPEALQIALKPSVPEALHSFHALTRARRSHRKYLELSLTRDELEALLHTACGVTGTKCWTGREAKLRAYPSSGALYAVEIYALLFRVEGLDPAIYHYRPVENMLEVVKSAIDQDTIVGAMLPMERQMVSGAAAMICLTGNFPRHERKYGEGGYRMLIAEAGHISQNLVLAATALGLAARPFGGVFDGLLNQDLGLEETEEEFLLAVLVGRTGTDGQ